MGTVPMYRTHRVPHYTYPVSDRSSNRSFKLKTKGPDNPTSQLLPIMSFKGCSGVGEGRKDKGGGERLCVKVCEKIVCMYVRMYVCMYIRTYVCM